MNKEISKEIVTEQKNISLYYDNIIDQKIKFGKSQKQILAIITICWWLDAAELLIIGFIKPILTKEWDLNLSYQAMLGSSVFFGWTLGNLVSALVCDTYGRKNLIYLNLYGVTIAGFISVLSQNIYQFLIIRIFVGFFIGIGGPSFSSLSSEINPISVRARAFLFSSALFPIGEIIILISAYYYTDTLESGNWQMIIFTAAVVGIFGIILAHMYLIESPRFLLLIGKKEEALKILKYMSEKNNQKNLLDESDEKQLDEWVINQKNDQQQIHSNQQLSPLQMVFSKKILMVTIQLAFIWLSLCFVYYGIMFELPTIINELSQSSEKQMTKNEQFIDITYSILIELPGGFLAFYLVETSYGRKTSIIIANILILLSCILIINLESLYLIELITFIKFTVSGLFIIVIQYTTEIYPTQMRGAGVSFQNIICRVGGILMPIFNSLMIEKYGIYSLFFICFIVTLFSAISAIFMKKDTKDAGLDDYFKEQNHEYEQIQQYDIQDVQQKSQKNIENIDKNDE